MNFTSGLKTSLTDDWETPASLFNQLNREFGFTLDVCASHENHECANFVAMVRKIGHWTHKAVQASRGGAVVVALLPARTETEWFTNDVMKATELRFIHKRVKFGGSKTGAPFPSVIAIWGTERPPLMSVLEME